jgi:hypothetical protein
MITGVDRPQLPERVESRPVRQHHVEQHQVGAVVSRDLQALRDRADGHRREPFSRQRFRQGGDDRVFILDHQHRAPLKIHCLIVGRGKLQSITLLRRQNRGERISPRPGEPRRRL